MRVDELIRMLTRAGWKRDNIKRRSGHRGYIHKDRPGETIIVPYHKSGEIPTGTANKIKKDAGLK